MAKRNRPSSTTEAAPKVIAATRTIVPQSSPPLSVDVVSRFKDAYAVLVIGKAARRHVFFGLPGAQKAVDRAHARGDFAELVLVQLLPVGEVL